MNLSFAICQKRVHLPLFWKAKLPIARTGKRLGPHVQPLLWSQRAALGTHSLRRVSKAKAEGSWVALAKVGRAGWGRAQVARMGAAAGQGDSPSGQAGGWATAPTRPSGLCLAPKNAVSCSVMWLRVINTRVLGSLGRVPGRGQPVQ